MVSKHPFTLLELMLVIALLGLTFSIIAIQAPKLFKGEAFERGVDQVKSRIALAQELMLNFQTDVLLTLTPDAHQGLCCTLQVEKPLCEAIEKEINRHVWVKGIEGVVFDDIHSSQITLWFDGTLGVMPKGKLILRGHTKEAILTLKGFPSSILRGEHVVEASEARYPETVFSFI